MAEVLIRHVYLAFTVALQWQPITSAQWRYSRHNQRRA